MERKKKDGKIQDNNHLARKSVLELSEFIKELEEVFGVEAAAPAAAVIAAPAAGRTPKAKKEEPPHVKILDFLKISPDNADVFKGPDYPEITASTFLDLEPFLTLPEKRSWLPITFYDPNTYKDQDLALRTNSFRIIDLMYKVQVDAISQYWLKANIDGLDYETRTKAAVISAVAVAKYAKNFPTVVLKRHRFSSIMEMVDTLPIFYFGCGAVGGAISGLLIKDIWRALTPHDEVMKDFRDSFFAFNIRESLKSVIYQKKFEYELTPLDDDDGDGEGGTGDGAKPTPLALIRFTAPPNEVVYLKKIEENPQNVVKIDTFLSSGSNFTHPDSTS